MFFWLERDLATLADQGLTDSATDAIAERINRNADSYGGRRQHMAAIRDGGQFDGICRFSVVRPRFEDAE